MKIQTKILLITLLLVMVAGTAIIVVNQIATSNMTEDNVYDHLSTAAESRARHVETFLNGKKEAIKQLSESIVIERLLLTGKDDPDYSGTYDCVTRRLKNTAMVSEYVDSVFVLDKNGTIIDSNEEIDIGKDKSNDPCFIGGKEGAFIKDAYFSPDRKIDTIAFSAPVFDEEGAVFLGVVVMRVSMEELNEIATDRTGLGETGEIFLVNKDSYMVTPSRFADDTFLKQKIDIENTRNISTRIRIFGTSEPKDRTVLCRNYLGADVIGICKRIPDMNWTLVAEITEEEAFAHVAQLTQKMVSILVFLEAQLQQAQKMESIGTLAGGIAHDFNNLLSIIVGNAELAMCDVREGSPGQENLKKVFKACLRAKDLVKQILSFSRQTGPERKPVKISPIVKESLKLLRSSIPKTIDIRQSISCESDTVLADPTQINQVLINLCTNAVHAMEEKRGGTLEVSLETVKLDEDAASQYHDLIPANYVRLSVSDTGHGIKPRLIDRIFDPYFTTKEVGKGTGMGLAVIHGIVKNHGGAITVKSQPGKGTTVDVFFPSIETEVKPESEPSEAIPTGNEQILFVDDENAMAEMGKQMLEHLGYEVVTRTSSIEALELFRTKPYRFDLVITDLTMPNMTGDRLASELMNIRPDIAVILCTGYSERITEESAKAMGIRAFVMKPLAMRDMADTIRKVLDKGQG